MDRFSELPDNIIHHIMSYLSTKDAAQTYVLSKRWNHLRTSLPILDFDQNYFVGKYWAAENPEFFSKENIRRFCRLTKEFIQFVDASLLRFCELKVPMQKFRLSMTLLDVKGNSSFLDNWIELALANEVKEIDFNVQTTKDMLYSLPETIFSAKSLTTLKLGSCCSIDKSSNNIWLLSLKKLALYNVDEQMVQKFISECPLLEDLSLSLRHVCVSHAPKLKIVTIGESSYKVKIKSIEIVAPSLQQCNLIGLRHKCMINLSGCPHLNNLKLKNVDVDILDLISKIPLLEKLVLHDCHRLQRFAYSSNQLKDLQFLYCNQLDAIDVDAPNLLSFSYECSHPMSYMPSYPHIRSINAPCKLRFLIDHDRQNLPPLTWFKCIKEEFIGVAHQVKELSMSIIDKLWLDKDSLCFIKDSFTLDEFRKLSPSLPRDVENLIIDVQKVPPSKYAAYLDCLLWICFPRILCIEAKQQKTSIKFIEMVYEKLINRDTKCCNSNIIKCWRHYLKDFKIESFVPYKDPKLLHVDNLMVELPKLLEGTIRFHLDWCFFLHIDEA